MAPDVDAWGIQAGFHDVDDVWQPAPPDTVAALRTAMGAGEGDTAPPDPWSVWVVRHGAAASLIGPVEIELEDGATVRAEGHLPADLPLGYHTLHPLWDGQRGSDEPTRLIVSPGVCHPPPPSQTWGLAVQLYAARSRQSWGIGDLADLRTLGEWVAGRGGGAVLVNPIDAPSPVTPRDPSPYFPTSRLYRNPMYLRVEEVPGADTVDLADLRAAGRAANDEATLDHDAAIARTTAALERIWQAKRDAGAEDGFTRFRAAEGDTLETFATYCTLAEQHGAEWPRWPAEYRHPGGVAVRRFADDHRDRVTFHMWVQWLLDEQLAAAGRAGDLLRDLPVGFDPHGADAWLWQDLLADGVTVGAPPDLLGPQGQDWRLPAFVPWKLRQAGYEPIVRTLRSALRHAGGLRIDHVLGLFRLFWIPPDGVPAEGAYVRYPAGDLLDVLALESHRAGAWIVGEDLGTVEMGVREEMARRQMLRYQLLWFEEEPPEQWADLAVASTSTHDLPTVAGLWTGSDLDEQATLGLEPNRAWAEETRRRVREQTGVADDAPPAEVVPAVHALLARAAGRVVLGQLEDAAAIERRPNVPGTTRQQRANWSHTLPQPLDDLLADPDVLAATDALRWRD